MEGQDYFSICKHVQSRSLNVAVMSIPGQGVMPHKSIEGVCKSQKLHEQFLRRKGKEKSKFSH